MYTCVCINIKSCDKISSIETLRKQLCMTYSYITIDKANKKDIHSGGRWDQISSTGEPEQK